MWKGKLKLADGRHVDSMQMKKYTFAIMEGDVKFKAWKKIFDQIGKELTRINKKINHIPRSRYCSKWFASQDHQSRWFEHRHLLVQDGVSVANYLSKMV